MKTLLTLIVALSVVLTSGVILARESKREKCLIVIIQSRNLKWGQLPIIGATLLPKCGG